MSVSNFTFISRNTEIEINRQIDRWMEKQINRYVDREIDNIDRRQKERKMINRYINE